MYVSNLESIKIRLASPEDILDWSYGEVTKPETINYRTQRPEKDGLFCEAIFGPTKDYECFCGKYKKIRYKGVVCDKCGVEVTKAAVRRERMGHIKLATPVSHIWFLKGVPSRIGIILDIPLQKVEEVVYFISYIVTSVNEEIKEQILEEIEEEFKTRMKASKNEVERSGETEKVQERMLKEKVEELKEALKKAKEELTSLKLFKVLSENEYHRLAMKYGEVFEAGTGAETVKDIFEKVDFDEEIEKVKDVLKTKKNPEDQKNILRRLRLLKSERKSGVRPEWMFLDVLPVLPPDLRPMVQLDGGRYASSDLNDLYRRVINRNNRLKYLLEINAPDVIVRNEKRMLQEAVDALIDNKMRKGTTTQASTGGRRLLKSLSDMLSGKQGRFRQNLLGKRVDYSGRSVIVVGPKLALSECGVPKKMALELFKPFVIKKLLERELAYNVKSASRLIEDEGDEVWECLEEVVKNRIVLLNRAPTLHRLGIQGFYPILIEGEAIQLHPLVCTAFNADFDGDQMAIHLPLSKEAQDEARTRMLASVNLLKPATGDPIAVPTKDMVLGCYWLTKIIEGEKGEGRVFADKKETLLAVDLGIINVRAKIKVAINGEFIETSAGRIIFNNILPEDFAFENELMSSKNIKKLIAKLIEIYNNETVKILDSIKALGFEWCTRSGITWGMADLVIPAEKPAMMKEAEEKIKEVEGYYEQGLLSKEEKKVQVIEIWKNVKSEIEKLVPKYISKGPVFDIVDSGSRGSWSQPVQMAGMKGLVANPAGEIIELAIKNSFKEGLSVLEYFSSTHGARKGTADTALRTSMSGYLTRRLVDVAHDVIVTEEDCGETKGIVVTKKDAELINQDFVLKIYGRTALEDIKDGKEVIVKKGEIITKKDATRIKDAESIEGVRVASPLTCKTKNGICQKCYGQDLGWGGKVALGEAVGVVAAQAIGEPGTQLTMRTFHTGGVASETDITRGLPRVEEIFENRTPKGEAELAKADGKVTSIQEKEGIIEIENIDKKEVVTYKVPHNVEMLIKKGDIVSKGQALTVGSIDLKKLYKYSGENAVKRYIIKEIQEVYVSQGVAIHDKHVEIIVKQMFSKFKIKDAGDSLLFEDEVISESKLAQINEGIEKTEGKLVKADKLLLGVSRVALSTDSFLSAASFQETSRILIDAALRGDQDELRGLKENVILGKLVPIGTGYVKKEVVAEKE
ncbi:MAG: DNA-directed RNA polymerase subunit beta' [Candidatus Pacebacteria bacterium]|nr:DNA-directed RNA polymerase subunit beta' [Candidatus Paceibacterota bacterium]